MVDKRIKKIAIDARFLNMPGMGFNIYLVNLIESLRHVKNLEITYFVDKLPDDFKVNKNEQFCVLKNHHLSFLWEQYSLATHLLRYRYDVIITPCNYGLPLLFKKQSTKCVLVVHDLIPIEMPSYIYRRWHYTILFYIFVPISIYKSDLILTDSNYSANSIKRIFHRTSKVTYPPINFTPLHIDLSKQNDNDKYKIPTEKYIMYTGGFDPRKNVSKILKAFQKFVIPNNEYSLVLTGNPSKKNLKIINKLSCKNIICVGYVSEDEKNLLLRRSVALINASSMEGFGLPIVEAFRLGIPIITTVNSSLKEVVETVGVHIEDTKIKTIFNAMIRFSKLTEVDIEEQIKMGYEQLDRLRSNNSKTNIEDIILNVLN